MRQAERKVGLEMVARRGGFLLQEASIRHGKSPPPSQFQGEPGEFMFQQKFAFGGLPARGPEKGWQRHTRQRDGDANVRRDSADPRCQSA